MLCNYLSLLKYNTTLVEMAQFLNLKVMMKLR